MKYNAKQRIARIKHEFTKRFKQALMGVKREVITTERVVKTEQGYTTVTDVTPVVGSALAKVYDSINSEMQHYIASVSTPKTVVITDDVAHYSSNYNAYCKKWGTELRIYAHFNSMYKSAPYYVALSGNKFKNIKTIKYSVAEVRIDISSEKLAEMRMYYNSYRKMRYFLQQMENYGAEIKAVGQPATTDIESIIGRPYFDITNSIYVHQRFNELLRYGYDGELYYGVYNSAMLRTLGFQIYLNKNISTYKFHIVDATKYSLYDIAQAKGVYDKACKQVMLECAKQTVNENKVKNLKELELIALTKLQSLIDNVETIDVSEIIPEIINYGLNKDKFVYHLANEWKAREEAEEVSALVAHTYAELDLIKKQLPESFFTSPIEHARIINKYFDLDTTAPNEELLVKLYDSYRGCNVNEINMIKHHLPNTEFEEYLLDLDPLGFNFCFIGNLYLTMKRNGKETTFGYIGEFGEDTREVTDHDRIERTHAKGNPFSIVEQKADKDVSEFTLGNVSENIEEEIALYAKLKAEQKRKSIVIRPNNITPVKTDVKWGTYNPIKK